MKTIGKFTAFAIARHNGVTITLILCVASLMFGCAVLLHGSASGTMFLKPSQRHVNFGAGFENAEAESVAYRDPSEYEEYDRWTGAAQAEIIFAVANGPQTALQFSNYRLQAMTRTWAFNQGGSPLGRAPTHVVHDGARTFTYTLYPHQAAGTSRDCVAFLRSWDNPPDDPMRRPGKALFGYYCAPAGQQLSGPQAVAVLIGIAVDEENIPRTYFGQDLPNEPKALKLARGMADERLGNPEFPFHFSRYYNVGDNNALK